MKTTNFLWPAIFRPNGDQDLIRVGSQFDGGYIFSAEVVAQTEHVVSYGLGLNWDFERDICTLARIKTIHCYDHTITSALVRSVLFFAIIKFPLKATKRIRRINTALDYFRFFEKDGDIKHFRMKVGTTDSATETSVAASFARLPSDAKNVLLKCDIEGTEYDILDDLLAIAPKCNALAIEFHMVGTHLERITSALHKLRNTHSLDHFHVNNNGGTDANGIAQVIELTFTRKDERPAVANPSAKIPSDRLTSRDGTLLDTPNDPNLPEITVGFEPSSQNRQE